jgi:DNA mismatch endonuclease, patch repair protein
MLAITKAFLAPSPNYYVPDTFDKGTRSRIMSRILSKNTSIEIGFRKALWARGVRYRVHYKKLPGKPDIAFPSKRVAVFIDGDFWHGYTWKSLEKVPPKEYWQGKINKTIARDKKYTKQLEGEGWLVLRFWEHEIKENLNKCILKVLKAINGRAPRKV